MEDNSIEDLILMGVIEVDGYDPLTEDFLYRFTKEAKNIFPELHKEHMNQVHNEVMYFWERGYLNISDMSDPNPIITVTEKALSKEDFLLLPEQKQGVLLDIMKILRVV